MKAARLFRSSIFLTLVCLSVVTCKKKSLIEGTSIYLVTDFGNHRVLVYSSQPTSSTDSPDVVLGQPDFESGTANNGGVSASSLYYPSSSFYDGEHLVIVDSGNSRVLIWNSLPTQTAQPADIVLGQADMLSNATVSPSAVSVGVPTGAYSTGTRLFIADSNNARILIWNSFPTTNLQAADLVLGQPDMTSGSGGVTAQNLVNPQGLSSDGVRLFVSDYNASRVLIWNTLPTVNQQPADLVLGQPDMTTYGSGAGATGLNFPIGLSSDGTRLAVSDYLNNRILIWNTFPTSNQAPADIVVGQPDMSSADDNNGGLSAQSVSGAFHARFVGDGLVVSDTGNNRILIWNSVPTSNYQAADEVLGQPDMTTNSANTGGLSATSLHYPANFQ